MIPKPFLRFCRDYKSDWDLQNHGTVALEYLNPDKRINCFVTDTLSFLNIFKDPKMVVEITNDQAAKVSSQWTRAFGKAGECKRLADDWGRTDLPFPAEHSKVRTSNRALSHWDVRLHAQPSGPAKKVKVAKKPVWLSTVFTSWNFSQDAIDKNRNFVMQPKDVRVHVRFEILVA